MQRSTRLVLIWISITLNVLGVVNIATIASVLELRLAMRVAWITTWSWAMVWMCGLLLAFLAIGNSPNGQDR
jgi:hypothetical protein